ncbi:hypothetical protein FS837_008853 [Tulasnella sp. UAMH 9824]|nr:hypothetical protein FS837_008853 [Tulasnella sp. UAMH 9824]
MSEGNSQTDEVNGLVTTQVVAIDEVDKMMKRLRIRPRRMLESLEHLRIDGARITPIESEDNKRGGNADVEAAILVPEQSSSSSESGDIQYVAVKKLRFDMDTDDDRALALVFAWEKNGNLREFIRSESWELPERVYLIGDVASGLSYLHGRNPPICHGDLKSNTAVISDFGSARAVEAGVEGNLKGPRTVERATRQQPKATGVSAPDSLKAEVSVSGDFITMAGPAWTVRWAAPELLEGEPPSLESDIWAFGWICWEWRWSTAEAQAVSQSTKTVTGNFPFDQDNNVAVVRRIVTKDLPPISNNTQLNEMKILLSLLEDCLRSDATDRPTAITCQQVVSLMSSSHTYSWDFKDQTPPVHRGNSPATAHSSRLLNALGRIQFENGAISRALEYFRQSLEVGRSVGDEPGKPAALSGLGDSYRIQGEHSKAEDLYTQARDIYSQIGDQYGFAESVERLAHLYYLRAEYFKAAESYVEANDIHYQIASLSGFAKTVQGMGDVYQIRSERSEAEESYTQARDIFSEMGD